MPTPTDSASQSARAVTERSRILADETTRAAREMIDAYQNAYLTLLEGTLQATNRWFELGRVMLEQAELGSRDAKAVFERLGELGREQQRAAVDLARDTGRVVRDTWLGADHDGRRA